VVQFIAADFETG
jgi:hypothetical protein